MIDIIQLYQDYNVPYQTEGHKHCSPGWANTPCPFCSGNPGLHLGVNLDEGFFYCWRCGFHPQRKALSHLLNIPEQRVWEVLKQYGGMIFTREKPVVKIRRKAFKFPTDTNPLITRHKNYLQKRGFDPVKLEQEWFLMSTGPMSRLDNINYSHRILAPIHWEGQPVTFQARDTTNRHPLKYMACLKERELIHHKHIIYGKQEKWTDSGICVEGITDVWKLGTAAFCIFGIEFTLQQIRVIKKHFKRVAVIFDSEPQAQKQAIKLVNELRFRNVNAFNITVENDPGSMTYESAKQLVKTVL